MVPIFSFERIFTLSLLSNICLHTSLNSIPRAIELRVTYTRSALALIVHNYNNITQNFSNFSMTFFRISAFEICQEKMRFLEIYEADYPFKGVIPC